MNQSNLAHHHATIQRAQKRCRTLRAALVYMLAVITVCGAVIAESRVARFVVEQSRVFADGTSFGNVGQYERLDGTAFMEVDPQNPHNTVIVNLANAPRNARG